MDHGDEVRDFLTSRRAKVTPDQVGLPAGQTRRVPCLRRSEVATLAGLSVEYYAKIERGAIDGASEQVLDALARALLLDDAERDHLIRLALAAGPGPTRRRSSQSAATGTRPSLQWALDAVTAGPAFVRNGRMDLLATNQLGRAFYCDLYTDPRRPPNIARYTFLDTAARRFHPDWDSIADVCVAIIRTEAGRAPHDRELHDLVGELSTRSDDFRTRWGSHNVRHHGTGTKRFHHPVVGDLTFAYEGLQMETDAGLMLTIYTAEPGSASEQAMRLLASWPPPNWEPRSQREPTDGNGAERTSTETT